MLGDKIKAKESLQRILDQTKRSDVQALIDTIVVDEAAMLMDKYKGLDAYRVNMGFSLRQMYRQLAANFKVEPGSQWYVMSMQWIKQMHQYVYYDLIVGASQTL